MKSKYKYGTNDPRTALGRDTAICGGPNNQLDQSDQTLATLEALVVQQKRMQSRMAKILKDAEMRHRTVSKINFHQSNLEKKWNNVLNSSISKNSDIIATKLHRAKIELNFALI